MRLILRAAGAMRNGPEREMVDDYIRRADQMARGVGFHGVEEQVVDIAKCRDRAEETDKIVAVPDGAAIFILDERGKALTSHQFARTLGDLRDSGTSAAALLIGGADGFEPSALPRGARKISFGVQTWPHKLVRVMAAEQIYRALSIHAGSPYHRD